MQETINIYNTNIKLPEQPPIEKIDGYGCPKEQQKWQRKELPKFFDKVVYDKNGDLLLTDAQEAYASEEVKRCKQGYWFLNNEVPTYITGKNYFYLQWWKLEDDIYPSYRDTDRRYYLYLNYWESILWVLGVIRGKKRREGASSQACSNLVYEAIFFKNSNCGLISKTKDDGRDTFTDMISFGYRQLPVFLKPKQTNKEDAVTELVFAHKSQNIKEGEAAAMSEDSGHRSRINYKAPVLNAYDRGRMSRILLDEFGKLPKEVPASQLLSIVSKTLVKGVKRVGFVEMPSTVNSLTKGSGAEFQKIWKAADHFKKKPTTNRLVRYFTPAYDGYEGFIDEYGMSVIDTPTDEQYRYLVSKWVKRDEETNDLISELSEEDILMGARSYIAVKRRDGMDGDELEEEIRMNPCDEDEMFMSAISGCHFNSINIKKQLKHIEENPPVFRTVTFYRKLDQTVGWREEESGVWKILSFPEKGKENKFQIRDKLRRPANISDYVIGADGFSASQGGRKYGSMAGAFVMNRKTMQLIAMYFGRPRTKELFHEQMMLASEYYGCKIWIEKTADSYFEYFKDRGRLGYLGKYPLSCIPIEKRSSEERYYGFPITPFAMTRQLDTLIAYVDDYEDKNSYCQTVYFDVLLEQMLLFEAENRTKSDLVVAAMITLCCALEPLNSPNRISEPIIKVYQKDYQSVGGSLN